MKKLFSLILVLILLLSFTGCSKSEDLTGSGTETDPYRIGTAGQLLRMAELINTKDTYKEYSSAHYLITADIDLEGKSWTPIAIDTAGFSGVLDGDGHTISGFQIKTSKDRKIALISELHKGTVKNLTVSNATISGSAASAEAAAIVSNCIKGTIENCHTTDSVTVTSTYTAAGICSSYNTDSPLVGCTNAATVTSKDSAVGSASGVVSNSGSILINCANTGTITSGGDAAGVAKQANGGLSNCTNSGSVTARNNAGGIVTSFDDGALNSSQNNAGIKMENCTNSGTVTSSEDIAGGIATSCRTGSIINCVNTGSVSAPEGAGGIFGYFQRSPFGTPASEFTVSGCTNSGAVTVTATTGNEPVGGICCQIFGASGISFLFENCTNTGAVLTAGQTNVMDNNGPAGGIIGTCDANDLTLLNCTNTATVTGVESVGGIIGQIAPVNPDELAGTVFLAENCSNSGDLYVVDAGGLTTEIYCGGIAGINGSFRNEKWVSFESLNYVNCSNTGALSGDTGGAPLRIHEQCGNLMSDLH